jgi:hypothetical protein
MSRSWYSEDCDNLGLWRGAVESAIRGKRGQAFLCEMAAALDAMPVRELVTHELACADGVCAMGAVAAYRKLDVSNLDPGEPDDVAETFGVARALVQEIAFENDEDFSPTDRTSAERWQRMRRWVAARIGEQSTPTESKSGA